MNPSNTAEIRSILLELTRNFSRNPGKGTIDIAEAKIFELIIKARIQELNYWFRECLRDTSCLNTRVSTAAVRDHLAELTKQLKEEK